APPTRDWSQTAEGQEQAANSTAEYRPDATDFHDPESFDPRSVVSRPHIIGSGSSAALQVHNKYLVAETDEGLVVIDQHALHERILYEQLREKVLGEALETQQLLVPEPVDLSPEE